MAPDASSVLVMVFVDLVLHRLLDLVRILEIEAHHAQRVADEVAGEMVSEDFRIALEERALLRGLDVLLEGDHALGLDHPCQDIKEAQKVAVVAGLPFRSFEGANDAAEGRLDDAEAVADEEGADGGAENHHDLEGRRLDDGIELAALGDEAAENGAENDDDANDGKQVSLATRGEWHRKASTFH